MFSDYRLGFNTQPPEGSWVFIIQFLYCYYLFQHAAARRQLVAAINRFFSTFNKFQHAAARRQLERVSWIWQHWEISFNTQPPEGSWVDLEIPQTEEGAFQHAAARRQLESDGIAELCKFAVSTRSRPKAAGNRTHALLLYYLGFNTQPPEGSWPYLYASPFVSWGFNTQPPEGSWVFVWVDSVHTDCFNTQPPEGSWCSHFQG